MIREITRQAHTRGAGAGGILAETNRPLQIAVERFRSGESSIEEVRSLAADIGNEHYRDGLSVLESLLCHDDPIVRYNVIMSLGFEFRHVSATPKLLEILQHDPDEDCRSCAAGALGCMHENTRNLAVIKALAHSALADGDHGTRMSAYTQLLSVNGLPSDELLKLLQRGPVPVDTNRVKQILSHFDSAG